MSGGDFNRLDRAGQPDFVTCRESRWGVYSAAIAQLQLRITGLVPGVTLVKAAEVNAHLKSYSFTGLDKSIFEIYI